MQFTFHNLGYCEISWCNNFNMKQNSQPLFSIGDTVKIENKIVNKDFVSISCNINGIGIISNIIYISNHFYYEILYGDQKVLLYEDFLKPAVA